MSTPSRHRSRRATARAAALAAVCALDIASGCVRRTTIELDALRAPNVPPSRIELTLRDDTRLELGHPRLLRRAIAGEVGDCEGASCERVRAEERVDLVHVRHLQAFETDPAAVVALALGFVAGALSITGAVVAAANGGRPAPPPDVVVSTPGSGERYTSFSCPQVYSFDGRGWSLDSGTYSGAHLAAAPRTDHDVLEHLVAVDGEYRLRMLNELSETDHTDALRLRVVDHDPGVRVAPALDGSLLTFTHPRPPVSARDLRGGDAHALVATRDERLWRSRIDARDPDRAEDLRDGLVLEFERPAGATHARLWMRGTTTPWAERMVEDTLARLGSAAEGFFARLESDPAAREGLVRGMIREGMLQVSVWDGAAWRPRGYFWESGPELLKEQAMQLPLEGVVGDRVRVRLDAPLAFWTIDAVALDFDAPAETQVRELLPRLARHASGADLRATLAAVDGQMHTAARGDRVELTFDAPPEVPGRARTVVLVSTGWYRPEVAPAAEPDPAAVARMLAEPGALSRRSLTLLQHTLLTAVLR
ncbi:MAG: hypothetical protein R3A48_19865 [Polyangiales bacterium]